jgi:hypothetical protein
MFSSMLHPFPLVVLSLLSVSLDALAAPSPSVSAGQSISLFKRSVVPRGRGEWESWANAEKEKLLNKYGAPGIQKRGSGTNLYVKFLRRLFQVLAQLLARLTNQGGDST